MLEVYFINNILHIKSCIRYIMYKIEISSLIITEKINMLNIFLSYLIKKLYRFKNCKRLFKKREQNMAHANTKSTYNMSCIKLYRSIDCRQTI